MARLIYAINHPDELDLFEEEMNAVGGNLIFKQKPALNDRAMLHLEGAAMMEATMESRDYVMPHDVVSIMKDVLRARLILNESSTHILLDTFGDKYQTETQLIDHLLDAVLSKVELA